MSAWDSSSSGNKLLHLLNHYKDDNQSQDSLIDKIFCVLGYLPLCLQPILGNMHMGKCMCVCYVHSRLAGTNVLIEIWDIAQRDSNNLYETVKETERHWVILKADPSPQKKQHWTCFRMTVFIELR